MKHLHARIKRVISSLLGLLVLAGCPNGLVNPPETEVTPHGEMGQLTISLTGISINQGERTLFPGVPVSFSKYELVFTPTSGQKPVDPVPLIDGISHSLSLPEGTWTITALAYVQIQGVEGIEQGDYVAARGSVDVTVSASSPVNKIIDLHGGVDQGKGVFSYDIKIPEDLDSATLEILSLGGSLVKSVNLKTDTSGSFALDSGYYLLKVSRVKGENATGWAEVVHIYTALTTEAGGPGYDFTGFSSAAEMLGWLGSQPANTADSPYTVALSGLDLAKDLHKGDDPLGLLYEALDGKYVSLDMSACGGDLPGTHYETANNRPNRDKIVSVILPDSLASIGQSAFYGCSSLASIDLPDSLITMDSWAFSSCTSLTSIDLPDSLITMGYGTFSGTSLVSVDLSDSLTSIDLSNCALLTSIDLPDSVTYVHLYGCTSLASIDLPDSVTFVDLAGCALLTSIDLPDSVAWVDLGGCASLTSIDLPDSVTYIDLGGCTWLTSIDLPDSVTSFDFYGCTSLTSISLPDSLTYIAWGAFNGCTSLASIDLPDTLTEIKDRAFAFCTSLESIALPDSITSIGVEAFTGCTSLATVISRNTTPPELASSAFSTSSSLLIYVPDTSVAAYKSAWSDYASEIRPLSQLP
jgi:hypothetical protein